MIIVIIKIIIIIIITIIIIIIIIIKCIINILKSYTYFSCIGKKRGHLTLNLNPVTNKKSHVYTEDAYIQKMTWGGDVGGWDLKRCECDAKEKKFKQSSSNLLLRIL